MQDIDRIEARPLTDEERKLAWATIAMVESLPETGSVVLCHSRTVLTLLRDLIKRLRGADVLAETRVLVAPSLADEAAQTAGLSLPVFRDPFTDLHRTYSSALAGAWRLA